MNTFVSFLLSQSVLLPLMIGLIRIRKIHSSYLPFVVLIMLAALTEFLSYMSIRLFRTNAIVSNIYYLLECMLIFYQFYRWRFHARQRNWYWTVPLILLLIWITEDLIFMRIVEFGPVFRVSYSFLIVMLSINEINYLITHENRQLLKNARFLICIGFIIYFLYQILFEGSLFVAAREKNSVISNQIILLSAYINVLVNVIYGLAMCFIPARTDFERTMESLKKHHHQSSLR